jgi:hypothetical protein
MLESFFFKFHGMAAKAHEKGAECFKAGDYYGFLAHYFESGYYYTLGFAVNGEDHEFRRKAHGGKTAIEYLYLSLEVKQNGKTRATQSLKKLSKLEKQPEINAIIEHFVSEVSPDFIALSKKSGEIYHFLNGMGTWEKMKKGLSKNVNNIPPEDKLFMEDQAAMEIINRLQSPDIVGKLSSDILKMLKK